MSERLKGSIKRYLIQHYIQDDDQDDVFDKSRNNSSIDSDSSDFDNRNLLDTDVTHANTDLKIRNFPNIYVTNGDTDSENRKVSNDIQTLNSSSTDSGYHEEVRNVSEENMKITADVSSEFNEGTNKEINVENKQNIVERLNDVKRVLSELKKDESDELSLASDSFSHRNSRKRLETAPDVNQMNANENLNTTFLEKQVVKRTASLPPKLDVAEQIPVVSENLSEEEVSDVLHLILCVN